MTAENLSSIPFTSVRDGDARIYVLVHGLGFGGWIWKKVASRLRLAGHTVYTPTLTGLGERSHLASPEINLDTHINDVVNLMRWEDLHNVILLGHSYGGAVVTGAADRVADRIQRLVYLDAFILRDGESILALRSAQRVAYYEDLVTEYGHGWLVVPEPGASYGLSSAEDLNWVRAYVVAHPYATLKQRICLVEDWPRYKRSYIWASEFRRSPFTSFANRVRDDPDWDFQQIASGHLAMVTHPDELTEILLNLVQ